MRAASTAVAAAYPQESRQQITRALFALLTFAAIGHTIASPEIQRSLAAFAVAH